MEGAEPEPVVIPAEERRLGEVAIRIRSELVACAVGVELFPANVAFGMGERHGADSESAEAELVCAEALASTTDGTTTVTQSKLGRDDEDVTLLLFGDQVERMQGACVLTQLTGSDLAFTVVVERARLLELLQNHLDRTAVLVVLVGDFGEVALGDRIDRRDGEPSFGTVRERDRRQDLLDPIAGESERQAESLGDHVHLRTDWLHTTVLLRVHVA